MCAKFSDSRFSRSGDTIAGVEIKNGSRDPDHDPFGMICHPYAAT